MLPLGFECWDVLLLLIRPRHMPNYTSDSSVGTTKSNFQKKAFVLVYGSRGRVQMCVYTETAWQQEWEARSVHLCLHTGNGEGKLGVRLALNSQVTCFLQQGSLS